MAVYAAHLTRTLAGTPSIFEISAQEQLASTVRPALRKVVEFIATCNPSKFSWLEQWYDELYLLFNSIVQYHYLRYYAASFSESFYGLHRVTTSRPDFTDGFHLPPHTEKVSFILLVLLPYARSKIEEAVERYIAESLDSSGKSWRDRCVRMLVRVYSALHCAYETLCLVTSIAYMAGRIRYATPLLKLAGVTLQYAPDTVDDDDRATWSHLWRSIGTGQFKRAQLTFTMIGGAVLRGMEIGAFVIQFLKWWDSAGGGSSSLPVPDAPEMDQRAERVMNRCPLCLQPWRIPTTLPVSGYVFCYRCIWRELGVRGACPVTGYPAKQTDLIRMYFD